MDLEIKYNDNADEFMRDINFQMRIQIYIENHFYPAYTISSNNLLFITVTLLSV